MVFHAMVCVIHYCCVFHLGKRIKNTKQRFYFFKLGTPLGTLKAQQPHGQKSLLVIVNSTGWLLRFVVTLQVS